MSSFLENPYDEKGMGPCIWVRGNLHSHSTRSDGDRPPQEVMNAFAKLGYQFFALSDHDLISDYKDLDPKGMILLMGNEVTANGRHILQIGSPKRIEPWNDRQKVIDEINQEGGIAILNHPSWGDLYNHFTYEQLFEFQNYTGIEIFNGCCLEHPGSAYAVEKWDRLLSAGKKAWAFANDDSHHDYNDGRGWNVVRVQKAQVTAQSILEAFRKGSFYASTGVDFETIEVEGLRLRAFAPNAQAIEVVADYGRTVAFVSGNRIEFDVAPLQSAYIRLQAYGLKGQCAWTQPFFIRENESLVKKMELTVARAIVNPPIFNEKDPVWTTAKPTRLGLLKKSSTAPSVITEVRAVISKTHLTIAVKCEEPYMERIHPKCTKDHDPNLWTDESIELFMDSQATGQNYYHIVTNISGLSYATHQLGWHDKLKYKVQPWKTANEWGVQISFDLGTLGSDAPTTPGSRWGFHVCRNRPIAKECSMWARVGGYNHRPARFGRLQF
jgi:hypothetical protein